MQRKQLRLRAGVVAMVVAVAWTGETPTPAAL